MEIQHLGSLMQQDPAVERFGPNGLYLGERVLSPEQSLRWLQEIVAPYDLDERVPGEVRGYLEVARRLHIYGYFEYSFFAVAHERATFAVEFAVRQRFLDWYEGRVPVERGEGDDIETAVIETTDTWDLEGQLRRKRRKKWGLAGNREFNGSFGAHLNWAKATLDLGAYFTATPNPVTGEIDGGRLEGLRRLRNIAAHPSMNVRIGPPDSAGSIEFSWRFINALWGISFEIPNDA